MNTNYELVRNASVEVDKRIIHTPRSAYPVAHIVVNDKYEHTFPIDSRVSKHLETMTPELLQERFNGGTFFFVENNLHSFQDGFYNGFVHTDDTIDRFAEHIGFADPNTSTPFRRQRPGAVGRLELSKVWSKTDLTLPHYKEAGDWTTRLIFRWDPFVKTVNSSFDIVRQICTNGMVGVTSLLNTKVPLFNRWEEHLDISAKQIMNKVNRIVHTRTRDMVSQRATVQDCVLLETHAYNRLTAKGHRHSAAETDRLRRLLAVSSPAANLNSVYKDSVFYDSHLADQLPSHLTLMDAYNIATEISSHTSEVNGSSNFALDRIANGWMFDRLDDTAHHLSLTNPNLSTYSSPEVAFFG